MTKHRTPLAIAALMGGCLAAPAALGNDTTAELAAGGLVVTKSPAIEMRSEELYISEKAVRVRYRFANTTARDVTVLVAFPMPDITTNGVDDMISIPTDNPQNILGFTTRVDGQLVVAEVEQRALKNGVDRTALLRSLGIPLAPHLKAADQALERLPKATQDRLVKLELATPDDYDAGNGWEHHLGASWTLKTTYFWRQTFPAGREVVVEHDYTPSVGQSAGTDWGSASFAKDPGYVAARRRYCVEDSFIAGAKRAIPAGQDYPAMTEARIDYILSTGGNWRSPIGDFRMVIDKGDAANPVSFCAEGVRKIGPTEFEVRRSHFTPTSDVAILILKPRPADQN